MKSPSTDDKSRVNADQSGGPRQNDLLRALLFGAGQGLLVVAFGTAWTAIGQRASVDVHELMILAAMGALCGVIFALVLYFTRSFRQRGRLQDSVVWMLGGFVAAIVVVIPGIPSEGWIRAIALAILLGPGAGLGLFVFARLVKGDHW